MRLLVCGGRTWGRALPDDPPERKAEAARERDMLTRALDAFHARYDVTRLIHGNARGADSLAAQWAKGCRHSDGRRIWEDDYPANWRPQGPRGPVDRSAGHRRNAQMLAEGKPDAVLAFPGGRGTQGMMNLALKAKVPVWRVYREGASIQRVSPVACEHGGLWVEEIEDCFCSPCEANALREFTAEREAERLALLMHGLPAD